MKNRNITSFLVIISILMIFIFLCKNTKETFVTAIIAKTPQQIKTGLMFVKRPLPSNHGMLFDYGGSDNHKMWMKNTLIPLDIIFLGNNKEVLGSVENAEPLSMDLLSIDEKSRYALEMNAGWVKKNRINRGDVIEIRDIKKIA